MSPAKQASKAPAVAAVDWGTTRMRVWLIDEAVRLLSIADFERENPTIHEIFRRRYLEGAA